jgi:glycosyltransferase involved in cell wall biosynthesis
MMPQIDTSSSLVPDPVPRWTEDKAASHDLELTILMPCLNEAETIAICIRKAKRFLETHGVSGEVLIADNGSTDGSITIAENLGARVEPVATRGYGAALAGGIAAARGKYVIMGDADDSYDFTNLMPFVTALREGNDVVVGNRFRGGIEKGAMPVLHRWLGNPVLSFLGRLSPRLLLRLHTRLLLNIFFWKNDKKNKTPSRRRNHESTSNPSSKFQLKTIQNDSVLDD